MPNEVIVLLLVASWAAGWYFGFHAGCRATADAGKRIVDRMAAAVPGVREWLSDPDNRPGGKNDDRGR